MENRRSNEGHKLIKSTAIIHMANSLGLLVVMYVIVRGFACYYFPSILAVPLYECFWMQLACFIVRAIWSDFLGRGLLLTFKKSKAYFKTQLICTYLITLPAVCLNVFLVPHLIASSPRKMFWENDDIVRIW